MGNEHVFMIHMFITSGMHLSFCMCGLIPSAIWGLCNSFSSPFRCSKLTLNRENFLHFRCSHRCFELV